MVFRVSMRFDYPINLCENKQNTHNAQKQIEQRMKYSHNFMGIENEMGMNVCTIYLQDSQIFTLRQIRNTS